MASPKWAREPGLPGFGGGYGSERPAAGGHLERTLKATADLVENRAKEAELVAGARAAKVLLGDDPQPPDPIGAAAAMANVLGSVTGAVGGLVDRVQADNDQLRAAQGQDYDRGRDAAKELNEAKLDALAKSHEAHLASLSAMRELSDSKDAAFMSMFETFRKELADLRERAAQERADRLQRELEEIKAKLAAPAATAGPTVPVLGARPMQLPDGRTVYVMDGGGKSDLATLKESLGHLQELSSSLESLRGPKSPGVDLNDPETRWRHSTIDWEDRARAGEQARLDKLANAQVEREKSLTNAIMQLPNMLQKHAPRVITALSGGAPERGAHNGLPDRPPVGATPPPPPGTGTEGVEA